MVRGGGMSLVKYLIFGFNLIFVAIGLGLIIVGGLTLSKFGNYDAIAGKISAGVPILVIVVGVMIFVIAFFGCCGAVKENHCMTITYSVLLFIILVLEFSGAIAGYLNRDMVKDEIGKQMDKSIPKYDNDHLSVKNAWDDMQLSLPCCGVHNYTDWLNKSKEIPGSCCKKAKDEKCEEGTKDKINPDGCLDKFEQYVKDHIKQIAIALTVILFVQVLGIICACCLANAIKKQYEVV